jgi:hypothetical protein
VQAINRVVVQTSGVVQTDKPDFTEWTARPPIDDDDEDETEIGEGILDRL